MPKYTVGAVSSIWPSMSASACSLVCEGVKSCRGRHEEAEGSFEAAVRVNPTSARAFFHLGNVQFALRQYAAAETSFHTALKASLLHQQHSPFEISTRSQQTWHSKDIL